jgi:hypothetical protein
MIFDLSIYLYAIIGIFVVGAGVEVAAYVIRSCRD